MALKSWAKARAVRLAVGDAASDDAGADLFNTDAKLPGELLELRDWVGAVAANVSVKLETRQSYDGHAANCRRVLRVRAVLRRRTPEPTQPRALQHGALAIDPERHRCFVEGDEIELTAKEFWTLISLPSRGL